MIKVTEYSFYNKWVQDMLWNYLNPSDIHWTCTKLDAMRQVQAQYDLKECYFIGSEEHNFLFRIVQRNPFVAEPHIMGDGTVLRSVTAEAYRIVFSKGVQRINVYTQYPKITRIMKRFGLQYVGTIPKSHLDRGSLVDVDLLTITKDEYERTRFARDS